MNHRTSTRDPEIVDSRSVEEKYAELSTEMVRLRLRCDAESALLDDMFRRVRSLEAISVLDLIPEDVRS